MIFIALTFEGFFYPFPNPSNNEDLLILENKVTEFKLLGYIQP